jgi:hypothetical protein
LRNVAYFQHRDLTKELYVILCINLNVAFKTILFQESEVTNTPIPGTWVSVLQIQDLVKDDVDKQYQVVVKNTLGESEYPVYLSTSDEPKLC